MELLCSHTLERGQLQVSWLSRDMPHTPLEQTGSTSRPGKWVPLEESYSDYTHVLSHNNMLPSGGSGTQPIFPHNDILPMEKFTLECTLSLACSLTHKHTFPLLVWTAFFRASREKWCLFSMFVITCWNQSTGTGLFPDNEFPFIREAAASWRQCRGGSSIHSKFTQPSWRTLRSS